MKYASNCFNGSSTETRPGVQIESHRPESSRLVSEQPPEYTANGLHAMGCSKGLRIPWPRSHNDKKIMEMVGPVGLESGGLG